MVSEAPGLLGRRAALDTLDELMTELAHSPDWENLTLPRYLEALSALLGFIENHYANTGQPVPDDPWRIMADALRGSTHYE